MLYLLSSLLSIVWLPLALIKCCKNKDKDSQRSVKNIKPVNGTCPPGPPKPTNIPPVLMNRPKPPVSRTPVPTAKQEVKMEEKKEEKVEKKMDDSPVLAVYPSIKEPTHSTRRRREEEIENVKKTKIAEGFFQTRSDGDDTLEQVASLDEEKSAMSKKKGTSLKIPPK